MRLSRQPRQSEDQAAIGSLALAVLLAVSAFGCGGTDAGSDRPDGSMVHAAAAAETIFTYALNDLEQQEIGDSIVCAQASQRREWSSVDGVEVLDTYACSWPGGESVVYIMADDFHLTADTIRASCSQGAVCEENE